MVVDQAAGRSHQSVVHHAEPEADFEAQHDEDYHIADPGLKRGSQEAEEVRAADRAADKRVSVNRGQQGEGIHGPHYKHQDPWEKDEVHTVTRSVTLDASPSREFQVHASPEVIEQVGSDIFPRQDKVPRSAVYGQPDVEPGKEVPVFEHKDPWEKDEVNTVTKSVTLDEASPSREYETHYAPQVIEQVEPDVFPPRDPVPRSAVYGENKDEKARQIHAPQGHEADMKLEHPDLHSKKEGATQLETGTEAGA
jgi:hypothetical protein